MKNILKNEAFFVCNLDNVIRTTRNLKEWKSFVFSDNWKGVDLIDHDSFVIDECVAYPSLMDLVQVIVDNLNYWTKIHLTLEWKGREIFTIESTHYKALEWNGYSVILTYDNWKKIFAPYTVEYKNIPYMVDRIVRENNII